MNWLAKNFNKLGPPFMATAAWLIMVAALVWIAILSEMGGCAWLLIFLYIVFLGAPLAWFWVYCLSEVDK